MLKISLYILFYNKAKFCIWGRQTLSLKFYTRAFIFISVPPAPINLVFNTDSDYHRVSFTKPTTTYDVHFCRCQWKNRNLTARLSHDDCFASALNCAHAQDQLSWMACAPLNDYSFDSHWSVMISPRAWEWISVIFFINDIFQVWMRQYQN